ncbi:MAG: hypothetical protein COV75_03145 [Candidatus Omnitrophica bacterium CG11_big_fil_rev_8_21_14_0_20_63_9]|nr:MAG: hypothetical protein COV75_03145 [Candidatus Omnitrophica bacterium CG11_big_fil_rev_8_21_14_0_20_63_9]
MSGTWRFLALLTAAWSMALLHLPAESRAEQQRVPIRQTGWQWDEEEETFDYVEATVTPSGHVLEMTPLALPPSAAQTQGGRDLPTPGEDEDCTVVHGVCQGTWNPHTDDPWNRVPPWDGYWEHDPAGTPWEDYGFQDPRPPVEEHEFAPRRQPGATCEEADPGSYGAFDPQSGLYDWVKIGSHCYYDTPGRTIGEPGGCKGSGDCHGKATTAGGVTSAQGGAALCLEAHNPNLAREVMRMDWYYNPEITYDMVNAACRADDEQLLIDYLTKPPATRQGPPPGTRYVPWGGGSTRNEDFRPWNPTGDDDGPAPSGRRPIGDRGGDEDDGNNDDDDPAPSGRTPIGRGGSDDDTGDTPRTPPPAPSGRCGTEPPVSDFEAWRTWFMCMQ